MVQRVFEMVKPLSPHLKARCNFLKGLDIISFIAFLLLLPIFKVTIILRFMKVRFYIQNRVGISGNDFKIFKLQQC